MNENEVSKFSVWGFVLGLISVISLLQYKIPQIFALYTLQIKFKDILLLVFFIITILSIIFCLIGLYQTKKKSLNLKGVIFAIIGLILAAYPAIVYGFFILLWISIIGTHSTLELIISIL